MRTINLHLTEKLSLTDKSDTVLINSNFDCGYFLDRNKLFNILKVKYKIQSVFDPCSYPGIQCRIFFDGSDNISHDCALENYGKVSFMIFRTGSVLIVGKCNMVVLNNIYEYIKKILQDEYNDIYEMDKVKSVKVVSKKKIKHFITLKV